MPQQHDKGFTLLELSLVIVVIGLVIGGILVGRDLLNAAQLRSVIKEVEQFKTEVGTFKARYNALPGDMVSPWTVFGDTCPIGGANPGNPAQGNGNGLINEVVGNYSEIPEAMCELGQSGLINGKFCPWGTQYPCDGQQVLGPLSAYSGVTRYFIDAAGNCGNNNCVRLYNTNHPDSPGETRYGALNPMEAKNIDSKIDDGQPWSGRVLASESVIGGSYSLNDCIVYDAPNNANIYNLPNANHHCVMDFLLGL